MILTGSSTDEDAEAEDAGDCRSGPNGVMQAYRLKGRMPGGRCVHWPACEGERPLPGREVWAQRGWEDLRPHELAVLKVLALNNLTRYLDAKVGHHAYASFDCGAVLELHRQLLSLLGSVLEAAALQELVVRKTDRHTTGDADVTRGEKRVFPPQEQPFPSKHKFDAPFTKDRSIHKLQRRQIHRSRVSTTTARPGVYHR